MRKKIKTVLKFCLFATGLLVVLVPFTRIECTYLATEPAGYRKTDPLLALQGVPSEVPVIGADYAYSLYLHPLSARHGFKLVELSNCSPPPQPEGSAYVVWKGLVLE